MASSRLRETTAAGSVPYWGAPRSSFSPRSVFVVVGPRPHSPLWAERFQLFLTGLLAVYAGVGMLMPLGLYIWVLRSPWWLATVAVGVAGCVVVGVALRLARHGRYQQSITLVCIGNWAALLLATLIARTCCRFGARGAGARRFRPALHQLAAGAGFHRDYRRLRTGYGCARTVSEYCKPGRAYAPRIQSAIFIPALAVLALQLLVIVWNNAAALRTSEGRLAEHAVELAASRTRLITAADEERRRLERDLHDGAQQHLVSLAVLIQLARTAEHDRYQPLLTEASGLLETAIAEIRRLAHGIYPPLLVSGGLAQAIPAVAARAPVPVQLNLQGLGRYPASIEAALYFCCSEALQNATKHGGPGTTVTITAHADDPTLTLTISDTGRGFDPATTATGLTNMTDRLSAIGGNLVIDTAPGHGTRITAVIPTPMQPDNSQLPGNDAPRLDLTHPPCRTRGDRMRMPETSGRNGAAHSAP